MLRWCAAFSIIALTQTTLISGLAVAEPQLEEVNQEERVRLLKSFLALTGTSIEPVENPVEQFEKINEKTGIVKELFEKYDKNKDGKLDRGEVHAKVRSICKCTGAEARAITSGILSFDNNEDEAVSLPEFRAGVNGDPHIRKWNGERFSFHGECDLVSLSSQQFDDGRGLDLHIRTTIAEFYSYIEAAALRIGNQTLEVQVDPTQRLRVNGALVAEEDLPIGFAGYRLVGPEFVGRSTNYKLMMENGEMIAFQIFKKLMGVDVVGHSENFGDSQGLMGTFRKESQTLSRSGKVMDRMEQFGLEWQVNSDDPAVFSQTRAPQWPTRCNMPSTSQRNLRHGNIRLRQLAKKACAEATPKNLEYCMFDVIATGDEGMAELYSS